MSHVTNLATVVFGDDGDVAVDPEFQVLALASAMLTTGVVMISPVLSDLTGPFGVPEARLGLFIVTFTAPQIVFIPLMGVLADRTSRKTVLVPGLLVFGLAGGAVGVTTSFPLALALRVLQGVGFAASMPLTVTVLGDLYDGRRETTAQGIRMSINFVSNIVAPAAAGVLVALSWRWPFALYLAMVPLAIAAWVILPEIEPDEKGTLRRYTDDLLTLLRQPLMALIMFTFLARFVIFYGYLTYVSTLGTRAIGTSAAVVGLAVSVKAVLSLIASAQMGRFTASFSRVGIAGVGFALSGIGVALPGVDPSVGALFVGSALLGVGDAVYGTAQKSLVTGHAPLDLRAGAISVSNLFQSVGKSGVPIAMGTALGLYGSGAAFVALGVVAGGFGIALTAGIWLLSADPD